MDGTFAEPRQRIGWTGTPKSEEMNVVPRFVFGVPADWIESWESDRFGGQVTDPVAPPLFESQATYLRRHGLLGKKEERML